MRHKAKHEEHPKLDRRKLLGFRKLVSVSSSERDTESHQLAFNKIGGGGEAPA